MLVDSHVNLHGDKFASDLPDVLDRAADAGVGAMLNICCNINDMNEVLKVANMHDAMWASVGTHPHDAKESSALTPGDILAWAEDNKVIGIGETGLDFHYNFSDREAQLHNFQVHIEAARESQLPLIIHSREADDEMADILERELKIGYFPALLHCYTSGPELARRAADLGVYFAMSGIITFKNAHEVREIAAWLPEDRLLIETDCPYLAPVPYRGKRCEPFMVAQVAEKLAEIRGWSALETAEKTTDAFFKLFQKAERPVQSLERKSSPAIMAPK